MYNKSFSFIKKQVYCCDKSYGLPHDELRAVSSCLIAILHRTSSGRQLQWKKRDASRQNSDGTLIHWYQCVHNGTLRI